MSDHQDNRAWLFRAGIVSLAVLAASACAPEFEAETCKVDSDCFQDEVCVDGACRLVVSDDDEAEDTGEGEDTVEDTGVEDAGPMVADLNIDPPTADLEVDSTIQLTAVARDSNGSSVSVPSEVSWSSNDTDVATVETQDTPEMVEVSGESEGTAVITASLGVLDAMATVRVTEESVNNEPVADAGSDETVTVNTTVQLDGSGSMDPDMEPLSYEWSFDSTPDFSSASLQDPSTVKPTFTPDVTGDYTVELTVSDGDASSTDTVVITAEPGGMDADTGMEVGVDTGMGGDTGMDTQGSMDATDTSSSDTSDTGTSTGDTSDADSSSTGDTSGADTS